MTDTTKLRELAQKATPGPWWAEVDKVKCRIRCHGSDEPTQITIWKPPAVGFAISVDQNEATASFIAQLNPVNILALLDEIDRLRKVEEAALQGERVGCRCTYTNNQTVDAECLYHRAIRSERDRLRAELTDMREDLSDARSGWEQASEELNDAAQCIANQAQTISRLQDIEAAARNLANVRGRHNSEIAMNQLLEALK